MPHESNIILMCLIAFNISLLFFIPFDGVHSAHLDDTENYIIVITLSCKQSDYDLCFINHQ